MRPFSLRLTGLATGLALIIFLAATPTVKADQWDLFTRITADHQIEVPGAVLDADTPYVIRLMNSTSDRRVVQVYNGDQDHLISMFIAVAAERMKPADNTTFTFMEVPTGHPVPVQTWFYPGRLNGLEFVYPKDQTDKFAAYWKNLTTEQVVQATTPQITPMESSTDTIAAAPEPAPATEQVAVVGQKSEISEINRAKPTDPILAEPEPMPTETVQAEPAPSEPVQIAQNTESKPAAELPHTAGELQLLGLVGALSVTLGAIRRRR